jgi:signal transduction histidine kinase
MLASKQQAVAKPVVGDLAQVLERFNESSQKLELRHSSLLAEVEELRAQLQRKEEAIKRSERLAMLGETAAALAHEVRNPLGAITLFLSMLKSDVEDRPQSLVLVDEIERSISSLDHVVSNVLHFAKGKKLQRGPVNVHSLLKEVHSHFINLYSSSANISLSVSGNPFILGDDQALRQCLYNIITNALQVTCFRGSISIQACDCAERDGVTISISDNGPGIPPEIMANLFEPFTSGRPGGTGLGLSIVRRIIEAHSGEINARNVEGAEFQIVLPRQGSQVTE